MANDRLVGTYGVDPNEVKKSVGVVTTCGTRQSFAYEKLMEVAGEMARGENSFIFGCGYELPVMHEQLDIDFINSLRKKDTYNPLSFAREYGSEWSGSSDRSLVPYQELNDSRILEKSETKADSKEKDVMYVLSYDVARSPGMANANSALVVIKCTPLGDGTYSKHVVNIYSFEGTHFAEQAKFLKQKVEEFNASVLVIDSNGLGRGLVDILVLEIDDRPPYSVINDSSYDSYKTSRSIPMIYALNSTSRENRASDIHNLFVNSISNQRVKFLVSESQARMKNKTKNAEKQTEELMPYIMTDLLIDEIMNLEHKQSGHNTQVERVSTSIPKDKFSALEYGLWWIHLEERRNQQRKETTFNPLNMFMIKPPSAY